MGENCEIYINEVDNRIKGKKEEAKQSSKEKMDKNMEEEMNRMNIFQNVRKEEIAMNRLAASKAASSSMPVFFIELR